MADEDEGASTNGKQSTSSTRVFPTEAYFDSPAKTTAPQAAELQSFPGVNQKQRCVQHEHAASPNGWKNPASWL